MKKATIIITAISILVSAATYFIIKNTDKIMNEITLNETINNSIADTSNSIESSVDDSADGYKYYYKSLELNQKQYLELNQCMQFYLKDDSFENANNCQENIVDAIVKDRGELGFIKSIAGDMLNYSSSGVSLNLNYLKNLVLDAQRKTYLKEKLILTFVNRYRDPIKLQEIYNSNKEYFYNYISEDIYNKVYKTYINEFLNSYNDIHEKEDIEAYYKDIYFKAEKLNKQSEYWFYTFWKRRELEKTDQIIYTILNEINEYYTN
jgi:hypothetical protein